MEYKGKNVLVCGMARSGIAAAELLCKKGASVILQDLKKREELSEIIDLEDLEKKGLVLYTGKNPDYIFLKQDFIV